MLYPGYIVAGGGRTGSHWLEQIVKFVTDYPEIDLGKLDGEKWVAHSNELEDLVRVDPDWRQTCALLVTRRRDTFAQAMSFIMAEHTDEWFTYTNKPVEAFDLDPQAFLSRQRGCELWNQAFDRDIRPLYTRVIDFEFEELLVQGDKVEDHVAQRLGIPNPNGHKDWLINRNPRDYRRLVRNWRDLGG